eukprot:665089-Rhodomonas_salina.1
MSAPGSPLTFPPSSIPFVRSYCLLFSVPDHASADCLFWCVLIIPDRRSLRTDPRSRPLGGQKPMPEVDILRPKVNTMSTFRRSRSREMGPASRGRMVSQL